MTRRKVLIGISLGLVLLVLFGAAFATYGSCLRALHFSVATPAAALITYDERGGTIRVFLVNASYLRESPTAVLCAARDDSRAAICNKIELRKIDDDTYVGGLNGKEADSLAAGSILRVRAGDDVIAQAFLMHGVEAQTGNNRKELGVAGDTKSMLGVALGGVLSMLAIWFGAHLSARRERNAAREKAPFEIEVLIRRIQLELQTKSDPSEIDIDTAIEKISPMAIAIHREELDELLRILHDIRAKKIMGSDVADAFSLLISKLDR